MRDLPLVVLVALAALLPACASAPRPLSASPAEARLAPAFDGATGAALDFEGVLARVEAADIVILGEQHDDMVGHGVQREVMREAAERWPGTILSLEMIERDAQEVVDDYLDGIIDAEALARLSRAGRWTGWEHWYQPTVSAALSGGGRVVAANAPRRYVTLARKEGYERLAELPDDRRRWVEWPDELPTGPYRDRFAALMGGGPRPEAQGAGLDDDMIDAVFRAQCVWDTTMADSIADAWEPGGPRVIHLVGQFHSDFEGGTVAALRAMEPDARILVVSMQRRGGAQLHEEDRDRADVVVYTGAR